MFKSLSIVIPCYNESQNLNELIKRVENTLIGVNYLIEVIIVNNGSTDDTKDKLERLINNKKNIKVLNIGKNIGYGHGILEGLKICKHEFLGWTHADLQCDFVDCLKAFDLLYEESQSKENIIIKGKRINRNMIDNLFTFLMSIFVLIFFQKKITDINAQPKIFKRELYQNFFRPPQDFLLDLYILSLAKKLKYQIISIDVNFGERKRGSAKGGGSLSGKLKLSLKTIYYIIKNTYGNNNSQSK